MAKNNFYGVRVGRKTGVFNSWDECKSQVYQYPGAIYKGFVDEESAREFVYGTNSNIGPHNDPTDDSTYNGVIAYVDGSFDIESNKYSYGVVILNGTKEIHLSDIGTNQEMAKMRNVAGEIMGSMVAMKYAKDNGLKEILIIHDYQGISSWAKRDWKTNLSCTEKYRDFYDKMSKSIKIRFQKCKGHSGDFYNDVADALAKRALGVKIKKSIEEHLEKIKIEN
jgi:ribonuclease HI